MDAEALAEIEGTFFSAPPTDFDPAMGYRWLPGPIRIVRVIKGELIMDQVFGGNNYGYNCSYDFTPRKPSPRTFRFIAFGDSYTNGIHMDAPWPQRLQTLLRSRLERWREIEVYPCPIDGGGLLNWHSVLMNQILPDFEFDVLIIGSWVENLFRDFLVFTSDETGVYCRYYDLASRPRSQEEFQRVRPGMEKLYEVMSNDQIEDLVRRVKRENRPAPVGVDDHCQEWDYESELAPAGYVFSPQAFLQRYGEERMRMFLEIVQACQERSIPIIFCSMPTRQGLLRIKKEGGALLHRMESQGLCQHFGLHYFDGYGIFDHVSAEGIVDLYWLKYDAHWNPAASDLFAIKLAEWITCHPIIPTE